ncbi:MAG: sodium:solute symporter [Acidobacteria bacterium]|nr:sodium:solute symporter [Acidobacteriota bacterium]
MRAFDWLIVAVYLIWIVWDGLRRTKRSDEIEGYFLANRSLPWWAVGLSVMATQLSAITLVGTTGQGYADGLRFVQFYYGLPLAMIILSVTLVPFFHRARVYTAYEYLEKRFDVRVRSLTSFLFLASRSMSLGVVISAPSVILSIILGWPLWATVAAIGAPTIAYTMFGGVQAVTWADVKQMGVITFSVLAVVVALILGLPQDISVGEAMHLAGSTGRLESVDFSFSFSETYTFWSGLIGGLFLMLGYFGCDQSQVQRHLTARSVNEGRHSLLMSAYAKIPLQVLILLTGVLVFVFYLFNEPPMLFNRVHDERVRVSDRAGEYTELEAAFRSDFAARRDSARSLAEAHRTGDALIVADARARFLASQEAVVAARNRAAGVVMDVTGDRRYSDVNYVFPTFITTILPVGLTGLMIAAIFAAVMSSVSSELNSLSTATIIDFYRRHFRTTASQPHYLFVSKLATGVWGVFACIIATQAAHLGALIEVVNRVGSFFYGSILGVFVLAVATRANTIGALVGLVAGMTTVALVGFTTNVAFLWQNVIGTVTVVVVGQIVTMVTGGPDATRTPTSQPGV